MPFHRSDDEDISIQVAGNGSTLTVRGPAAFYAPGRIVALQGQWRHERGQFLRDRDGRIEYLRMGGGLRRQLA